jgi:hypothetical protein
MRDAFGVQDKVRYSGMIEIDGLIRRILEEEGVPNARFAMIAGRADTQPLFPDDRRVTITLMREAPPILVGFKP